MIGAPFDIFSCPCKATAECLQRFRLWEEFVELFGVEEDGKLIFTGPRATVVPRPEDSTRGTEILDRHGEPISPDELAEAVNTSLDFKVILTSRTSRTTGSECVQVD